MDLDYMDEGQFNRCYASSFNTGNLGIEYSDIVALMAEMEDGIFNDYVHSIIPTDNKSFVPFSGVLIGYVFRTL